MRDPVQAYYARGRERDRLAVGAGRVEFERTIEIVSRTVPIPPAVVADIGGGPGRYTDWLVAGGYQVVHRDPIMDHVTEVIGRHGEGVDAAVGDARAIDLPDASVDAVLLLGPLYHLDTREDRVLALRESARIVRARGMVYAAAISRVGVRLSVLAERRYVGLPSILALLDSIDADGLMPPLVDGGFNGYAHTPQLLADEVRASGLELVDLVAVEGIAAGFPDLDARMDDPADRDALLRTLKVIEARPDALAVTAHLLAVARRPSA